MNLDTLLSELISGFEFSHQNNFSLQGLRVILICLAVSLSSGQRTASGQEDASKTDGSSKMSESWEPRRNVMIFAILSKKILYMFCSLTMWF